MTRVLVDTSAWIEFYHPRGKSGVKRALTEVLEHQEVSVVAPIVVELLHAAKTESTYKVLHDDLRALSCLPLGWEEAAWAAKLGWALRRAGQSVPTVDLLIAAAAQVHQHEVWHFGDRHFKAIMAAGGPSERDLTSL